MQSHIPFQPNPFFYSQNEIASYEYRENCIITQKFLDSRTQMGTMESPPQEFHQVTACNSEHENKNADINPLKGQAKIPQPLMEQCPFKTSLLS